MFGVHRDHTGRGFFNRESPISPQVSGSDQDGQGQSTLNFSLTGMSLLSSLPATLFPSLISLVVSVDVKHHVYFNNSRFLGKRAVRSRGDTFGFPPKGLSKPPPLLLPVCTANSIGGNSIQAELGTPQITL